MEAGGASTPWCSSQLVPRAAAVSGGRGSPAVPGPLAGRGLPSTPAPPGRRAAGCGGRPRVWQRGSRARLSRVGGRPRAGGPPQLGAQYRTGPAPAPHRRRTSVRRHPDYPTVTDARRYLNTDYVRQSDKSELDWSCCLRCSEPHHGQEKEGGHQGGCRQGGGGAGGEDESSGGQEEKGVRKCDSSPQPLPGLGL